MKKEYDFSGASPRRERDLPVPAERRRHTKVRITMMVDEDVLTYFKARAEEPGAEPYQTQMNRVLREAATVGASITGELLADETFISKVAERVAAYRIGRAKKGSPRPKRAHAIETRPSGRSHGR